MEVERQQDAWKEVKNRTTLGQPVVGFYSGSLFLFFDIQMFKKKM